jgi:16S rRNA (guanine966-N2)-methyltransferase
MRIIAGSRRGRRLQAPRGLATRPMLDRVREALFSTLAPWLPGARVLDLFAGSGSLGLEALSRGAERLRLVEQGPAALEALRSNVEQLEFGALAEVRRGDALDPLVWQPGPWDLVFLDPPYPLMRSAGSRRGVLAALASLWAERLAPEGVLLLHVPRGELTRAELPQQAEVALREYGTQALWYVQRSALPGPLEEGLQEPLSDPTGG